MIRRALNWLRCLVVVRHGDDIYPERGALFITRDVTWNRDTQSHGPEQFLYACLLIRIRGRKRRLFLEDYDTALYRARPLYWLRITYNGRHMRKRFPMFEWCAGVKPAEHPEMGAKHRAVRYYPPTK